MGPKTHNLFINSFFGRGWGAYEKKNVPKFHPSNSNVIGQAVMALLDIFYY